MPDLAGKYGREATTPGAEYGSFCLPPFCVVEENRKPHRGDAALRCRLRPAPVLTSCQVYDTDGYTVLSVHNTGEDSTADGLGPYRRGRLDGDSTILVVYLGPARVLALEEQVAAAESKATPGDHCRRLLSRQARVLWVVRVAKCRCVITVNSGTRPEAGGDCLGGHDCAQ